MGPRLPSSAGLRPARNLSSCAPRLTVPVWSGVLLLMGPRHGVAACRLVSHLHIPSVWHWQMGTWPCAQATLWRSSIATMARFLRHALSRTASMRARLAGRARPRSSWFAAMMAASQACASLSLAPVLHRM